MTGFKRVSTLLILTLLVLTGLPAQKALAQYDDPYNNNQPQNYASVSIQDFYNDLAPYGQWIEDPQYGYVFVPDVDADFRPYYTNGHWAMTEYGNTWISNYPWGWACFHYGRWTYDNYYGWVWIPGTEWGPSWVDWRSGEGYYGWAPLGPGFDISYGFNNYACPDDWWVFLPPRYLYTPRYYHYWKGPSENRTIINNTTVINNTYVNNNVTYTVGPRAAEVQQITNKPVKVYHLASISNPGKSRISNNTVRMFRPITVAQTTPNGMRPAPPMAVRAPQPVTQRPQPVSTNAGALPAFKQRTVPQQQYTQPQNNQRQQPTNNGTQRYEWPVQRSQPQQIQQQPQQSYERPQPMQRPAPQPQQSFERPQPMQRPVQQPAFSRPAAPQPMQRPAPAYSRPAPAPAPHFSAPPPRMAPAPSSNRR